MSSSISILLIVTTVLTINALKIHTPQGEIEGFHQKSYKGREFETYYGIPYAKPPVGSLRFMDPEPFGKWKGLRNGSEEGPVCLQRGFMTESFIGSEDCLYINVYTPSSAKQKKYPVLVWIHGGAFVGGSGTTLNYLPDYLMDSDLVLVTLNYRLSTLGFASTEDAVMPGNYGLKDQALALKWVKNNIASYGGNPKRVTISGQSAGGASVHLHTISPLSKGLFHRAIPMSGAATCPWATTAKGVVASRTKKMAKYLGCHNTHLSAKILKCLQNHTDPETFVEVLSRFRVWESDPFAAFVPVVEPKSVKNAFLTESPFHAKSCTPMLAGLTSGEGAFRIAGFHRTGGILTRLQEINKDFDKVAPVTLYFDHTAKHPVEVARQIRKFYFGNREINKHTIHQVVNMYTDSLFLQTINGLVKRNSAPTHLYLFDYRGTHSVTDVFVNSTHNYGVCHADDLQYIFPLPSYVPSYKNISYDDKKVQTILLDLWTNFVIHGNPTPKGSQFQWRATNDEDLDYLHITLYPKMKKNLLSKRTKFWNHLPTTDENNCTS